LACKNETLEEEEEVLKLVELLVRASPGAVDVEDNDGNKAIDITMHCRLLKHMAKQPRAKMKHMAKQPRAKKRRRT